MCRNLCSFFLLIFAAGIQCVFAINVPLTQSFLCLALDVNDLRSIQDDPLQCIGVSMTMMACIARMWYNEEICNNLQKKRMRTFQRQKKTCKPVELVESDREKDVHSTIKIEQEMHAMAISGAAEWLHYPKAESEPASSLGYCMYACVSVNCNRIQPANLHEPFYIAKYSLRIYYECALFLEI